MKRSEINGLIEEAIGFFQEKQFYLPPFAYFSVAGWRTYASQAQEIFDLGLGWDLTDFGSGEFDKTGLLLFSIRNGKPGSEVYPKSYAEKIMIVKPDQVTPVHYHWFKMEDIINRGGGDLVFKLYNADEQDEMPGTPVTIVQDGIRKTVDAGEEVILKPGESLTLPQKCYHTFYGRGETVMVGEVSMVNDDANDNRFFDTGGRFPEIEEDVLPKYLLCNDYEKYV